MNLDPWDCSLRSDVFVPDSIACNTHNVVYTLVHYIVFTLVKIVNAFLWYSGEVLLWGNQGVVLWLLCIWIALLYDSLKDFVPFSQPIRRKPQTNHVTCSHAFSRRTVTRGTHHLQDIIGSFECLLVSWLIRSIAKVLLLRCSFENSPNNWSLIILAGLLAQISQMPIVLIPVHFDRDPIDHIPSCQRSVVIRTFITNDFMTGVPATPGKHIPIEVSDSDIYEGSRSGIFNPVFYLE